MEKSCPFCTPSATAEVFIGSLGQFRVIAGLGQISDGGYVLLVPHVHVPCLGEVEGMLELHVASDLVSEMITKEYDDHPVTMFEHGIVGQTVSHAHLHMIPGAIPIGRRVRTHFPGRRYGKYANFESFQDAYRSDPKPYLLWKEPDKPITVCWEPEAPSMYLRIVVADLLGRPGRANWRTTDAELDRTLYLDTVSRMKKYF